MGLLVATEMVQAVVVEAFVASLPAAATRKALAIGESEVLENTKLSFASGVASVSVVLPVTLEASVNVPVRRTNIPTLSLVPPPENVNEKSVAAASPALATLAKQAMY